MSVNQTWGTPKKFMEYLEFFFDWKPDLDAAASWKNAKAENYIDEEMDSLKSAWFGNVWLNPPFGRVMLPKFLEKCNKQIKSDRVESIYVLIPARTDTKWFHDIVMKGASRIYLIKGRFNFDSPYSHDGANAPFPSMLVIYEKPRSRTVIETLEVDKLWRGWPA